MNRREFLVRVGGTLVAIPFVLEAVSCGDDSSPTGTPTDQFDAQSEVAGGHTHSIRIVCTQLTSSTDILYTSSNSSGHTHTVSLTVANLTTIAGGGQINTNSSTASGHFHQWSIRKPTGVC